MALPYELYLALRYLRFHRGRTFLSLITLISMAGVTVGTAALVIALALMTGFLDDVRERIYSGSAHLTVLHGVEAQYPGAELLARRLESFPGVQAASPVLYTPGMVSAADHGFVEIHGIDPLAHVRVIPPESADDPFAALARRTPGGREGIVLGGELATKVGAGVGDQVRVLVPRLVLSPWGAQPHTQVFEVVGLYRSSHFQQDAQRAYVSLESARRLLQAPGRSSWIELRLTDLRQLVAMKQRLREELGTSWLVVDLVEENRDIFKALNTEKLTLFLAIGLIVVVAALNIVSTLVLMVNDKVREIGTLTALGARPAGIARVFMLQGLVIGVVGTGMGLTLGTALALWLDRAQVIPLDPDVYYLSHLPFSPRPTDLIAVGCAALLVSFLATLYPALKASRLNPVEAIRHE
ncbi:MAG TPA: ABC transporter permease [Candidatus Polarisedimenticolaceae bacterium]|nr:ABC transporter permease [Candidatus Polarisedimenticolaceae bacterium]